MQFDLLPREVQLTVSRLLTDRDSCALHCVARFFASKTSFFQEEWLRRRHLSQIRVFNVIPLLVIQRCLAWQDSSVLKQFVGLLTKIHPQLKDILHWSPQAEWMVYALLNQSTNMRKALQRCGKHPIYEPYHFDALAGHWESYVENTKSLQLSRASQEQVAKWAMCGGHFDFVDNLRQHCQFPDSTQDQAYCEILLMGAIQGGFLDQVKILADQYKRYLRAHPRVRFKFEFAWVALKYGHFEIYDWLTQGETAYCELATCPQAEHSLFAGAAHDNLSFVQFLLEDKQQQQKWRLTLATVNKNHQSVRMCALSNSALKILRYIDSTRPDLLLENAADDANAIQIAAYSGQTALCRLLHSEFHLDPKHTDINGATSIHYAAKGGFFSTYLALVADFFPDTPLLQDKNQLSPLHYAAISGEYWFLMATYLHFGHDAFQVMTRNGDSLLHFAVKSLRQPVVAMLINEAKLSLATTNAEGNTPLHSLALRLAANPNSNSSEWQFIMDIASEYDITLLDKENNAGQSVLSLLPPGMQTQHRVQGL